eukprot:m.45734 g.45734  ORF g.45734 m.45734 type:complete len:90 (+) comp10689_c0_seq2:501-770(+)
MCGGTRDHMSRALLGVYIAPTVENSRVLIMDPHKVYEGDLCGIYKKGISTRDVLTQLAIEGWIKWYPLSSFQGNSRLFTSLMRLLKHLN